MNQVISEEFNPNFYQDFFNEFSCNRAESNSFIYCSVINQHLPSSVGSSEMIKIEKKLLINRKTQLNLVASEKRKFIQKMHFWLTNESI